jgi:hypothetical protein
LLSTGLLVHEEPENPLGHLNLNRRPSLLRGESPQRAVSRAKRGRPFSAIWIALLLDERPSSFAIAAPLELCSQGRSAIGNVHDLSLHQVCPKMLNSEAIR